MRVCMSGNGQGEVARAIMNALDRLDDRTGSVTEWLQDDPWPGDEATVDGEGYRSQKAADVAICTTGGMLIRHAEDVSPTELHRLHEGNYLLPRKFTERHIAAMRRENVKGLIIHLGSNAAWYGNVGADDYGAYKSALRKYLELRARKVREYGIRISCLGFGGIESAFWEKATAGADPELAKSIVPGARKPLTVDEAAAVVVATIMLPPNVCLRDALVVSTGYQ